ncbi:hypothetical protein BGX38DRAFT_1089382 [Terfezia claveryi]|nr:hypothetical protein BGX38DRAFT_1089382 [Terfezia claveryi]
MSTSSASATKSTTNPPPPASPSTTTQSSSSKSTLGITPYEVLDRRYAATVGLESWEVGAMRSIASDESIPRVRLRLLKALAGLPTDDDHGKVSQSSYPSGSGSGASGGARRRGGGGKRGRSD